MGTTKDGSFRVVDFNVGEQLEGISKAWNWNTNAFQGVAEEVGKRAAKGVVSNLNKTIRANKKAREAEVNRQRMEYRGAMVNNPRAEQGKINTLRVTPLG